MHLSALSANSLEFAIETEFQTSPVLQIHPHIDRVYLRPVIGAAAELLEDVDHGQVVLVVVGVDGQQPLDQVDDVVLVEPLQVLVLVEQFCARTRPETDSAGSAHRDSRRNTLLFATAAMG